MRAAPKRLVAGVDLGGTSMMVVVADEDGRVLGECDAATPVKPDDPRPIIQEIGRCLRQAAEGAGVAVDQLAALGIGVPGSVDTETGLIGKAVNLGWKDVNASALLKAETGLATYAAGDVQVAITGEHTFGAAKNAQTTVGIWIGTGLGGGIVVGGQLYRGFSGAAGEIGHMVIVENGLKCGCGRYGCAETLISRSAIAREIEAGIKAGRPSKVPEIMAKRNKERLTAGTIKRALDAGDDLVQDVIERAQTHLTVFVANLVNILDPEVVVIGGGLVEKLGDKFVKPVREGANAQIMPRPGGTPTRVVASALGDYAGALGATVVARRRLAAAAPPNGRGAKAGART
jgi:glucokinase